MSINNIYLLSRYQREKRLGQYVNSALVDPSNSIIQINLEVQLTKFDWQYENRCVLCKEYE